MRDHRGLRQYISDAVSAAASSSSGGGGGSHVGHKLIGSVEIPLRSIPASGFNRYAGLADFFVFRVTYDDAYHFTIRSATEFFFTLIWQLQVMLGL